jgi:hypothetical protein
MRPNGVAQSLSDLPALPGQAPLMGFGVDPQNGNRNEPLYDGRAARGVKVMRIRS